MLKRGSDDWTTSLYIILLLFYVLFFLVAVDGVEGACESCRPTETCKDGSCFSLAPRSSLSCDTETRWYLTSKFGLISDGPGNYSINTKCTWLIDARHHNTTASPARIKIRIDTFATECAWDHLYIWDGDSTNDTLLASLSGIIPEAPLFEVTADSGAAYLHFYSDAAYTMQGFNVSYEVQGCDLDCSSRALHGTCVKLESNGGSNQCVCEGGWTGEACEIPIGCNTTYLCQNGGNCSGGVCVCVDGFRGPDCSSYGWEGLWENVKIMDRKSLPPASASHATVLLNQHVYWIGGETFRKGQNLKKMHRLDLASIEFQTIDSSSQDNPSSRFGHTAVTYNDSIFMYGGVANGTSIVDELWQWETLHQVWIRRNYGREDKCWQCAPLAAAGHTAHVVNHKMLVIFGYGGAEHGFLNVIQELDFITKKWSLIQTSGAFVFGTYGHASVYDPKSGQIYINGGYTPAIGRQYQISHRLLAYDPVTTLFRKLRDSPQHPHFMHSGVLFDQTILWFGGCPHNESLASAGLPCYSADFNAYDIACDSWNVLKTPAVPYSSTRLPRYGHSALMYKEQLWIFGGFHGILLNDVVRYIPGKCRHVKSRGECLLMVKMGRRCAWSERTKLCLDGNSQQAGIEFFKCPRLPTEADEEYCNSYKSCHDCQSNGRKCQWCKEGNKCSSSQCKNDSGTVTELGFCPKETASACAIHLSCRACITLSNDTCTWKRDSVRGGDCDPRSPGPQTVLVEETAARCDIPCHSRSSCDACSTQTGSCMWCSNEERCIDSNAYLAIFPYGQCRDWQAMNRRCEKLSRCEYFKSCDQCMENPDCGWCDDGSSTGLGSCHAGSSRGPQMRDSCPVQRWFFVNCPSCNCNGHSRCTNGTSTCQACEDFTEGPHCDRCVPDRFGDPRNGGNCTQCLCPVNSDGCDPDNGNCKCTTKGTTGRNCEKCDEINHYFNHGGVCFYELPLGYQFTFNLTKSEDLHFTGINFKSTPQERDSDVKFQLICTNESSVNISYQTTHMFHEEYFMTNVPCDLNTKIERIFSHDQLPFGMDGLNTTVYVYVHDFSTPSVIIISFAQHSSLDLLHFFVVFACCFLSLLLLAAILWKVKQKYDIYRRRQRMFVEMEQMAKRPFACVHLAVPKAPVAGHDRDNRAPGTKKRPMKPLPSFVAMEPLADARHAVMSALICLPTGDGQHTPPGQTGLIIGSTLVFYGSHTRKPSLDSHKSDKLKPHKQIAETET